MYTEETGNFTLEADISRVLGFVTIMLRRRDVGGLVIAVLDPDDYIFPLVAVTGDSASPILQCNILFEIVLVPDVTVSTLIFQAGPSIPLHVGTPAVVAAPARVDILIVQIRGIAAVLGV